MTGQGNGPDGAGPNETMAMGCEPDSASASGSRAHSAYDTFSLAVVSETRRAVMVDRGMVVDFTVALLQCCYGR